MSSLLVFKRVYRLEIVSHVGILTIFLPLLSVWRTRDVYPGSRILIFTHPGSRISDPKTATKERGEKKFVVISFYVATNSQNYKLF
jgi:hypothetical protein